ncbi:acyl-CoA N-acyltransferase [Fomitopsis serialis]|uniref:acyl-CoA N-acyltransferase n=1 Tax=Fomitopsis serialis TaxID=139415 RepID=UPI0020073098|nr:acyl-CoA N-acyltransferase [Neoantrodia serialis]KAH9935302.1 acyl-CoA N-acyltransferase [Neoantrodia serialis]
MSPPNQRSLSRVSLASLTPNNLGTVRKLNSVLFPIKYSDKFYQDVLLPEAEEFCKLIYYNDIPVGTICCRMETVEGKTRLYLMTMGVLAPYRSRGLGSYALQHVLKAAAAQTKPRIADIHLHVQVSNHEAKNIFEGYYKKIVPHDAWVLEREIEAPSVTV